MTSIDLSRDARSYRLSNIDMLRGLVIVIMAIDHVRDYFHTAAILDAINQPDIPLSLFLTRWVTNFCAPVFIFLAGTSAGLMATRKSPAKLGGFLIKRGLWLILVEVTIVSTAWTFAPHGIDAAGGAVLIILQVIWAIGASMIALGVAQFLGPRACLLLGLVIVTGHNALDGLWPDPDLFGGTSSPLFCCSIRVPISSVHLSLLGSIHYWLGSASCCSDLAAPSFLSGKQVNETLR